MRHILISFDLKGDFGVFKKPDVNDGLQLTFNMLHKPALLGILGAIVGLGGYQRRGYFPEYYLKLRDLPVGIEPLIGTHDKGNFTKTVIQYTNTVGYANKEDTGTLIVTEQTLRFPAYRVYLMVDLDQEEQAQLYHNIKNAEAEYLPYFGKNECYAWWDSDSVQEYDYTPYVSSCEFKVNSIFIREEPLTSQRVEKPKVSFALRQVVSPGSFAYFERLPIDFFVGDRLNEESSDKESIKNKTKERPLEFVQYALAEIAFTDWTLKQDSIIPNLFLLKQPEGPPAIIQLF